MLYIFIVLVLIIIVKVVYLIAKGEGILLITVISLLFIYNLLINRRINDVFSYNRITKKISQRISVKFIVELWFKNNFDNKNRTKSMSKFLLKNKKQAEKFLNETKIKRFKTKTNKSIKDILLGFNRKGLLTLNEKGSEKTKKQQLEKLLLYGPVTLIKNIKNKEFWDFVNKDEIIMIQKRRN